MAGGLEMEGGFEMAQGVRDGMGARDGLGGILEGWHRTSRGMEALDGAHGSLRDSMRP